MTIQKQVSQTVMFLVLAGLVFLLGILFIG